jgi:hypothetical protein
MQIPKAFENFKMYMVEIEHHLLFNRKRRTRKDPLAGRI